MMKTRRSHSALMLLVATGLLAAGCEGGSEPIGSQSIRLHRATSCADLESSLKRDALDKMNAQIDALIASYSAYGGGGYVDGVPGGVPVPAAEPPSSSSSSSSSSGGGMESAPSGDTGSAGPPPSHSETNTQVAGVDEADIIKTDGNNIYLLHGQSFYTLTAWPASSLAVGSSLALDGSPFEMFVTDDKVVIYSSVDDASIYARAGVEPRPEYYDYGHGGIGVAVPGGAGPAEDGWTSSSSGGDSGSGSAPPPPDAEEPPSEGGGGAPPSEGGGGTPPSPPEGDEPMPPPEGEIGEPTPYVYAPLTKITVLSLAGGSPTVVKELYFEGGYASSRRVDQHVRTVLTGGAHGPALSYWPESLTSYPSTIEEWTAAFEQLRAQNAATIEGAPLSTWLPYRFEKQGDTVTELGASCSDFYVPTEGTTRYGLTQIEAIDLGDLSRVPASTSIIGATDTVYANQDALYVAAQGWHEPVMPFEIGDAPVSYTNTHLHKFDLTADPSQPRYVASGSVPGHILNQFSLDEANGKLRIATTEDLASSVEWTTRNNVFVLEARGEDLSRVGAVMDLAPGERIQSARFVGERGYVVTFRQIDPLFVLDLADPASPSVMGELHIPGFSEYMHPIDDGHLLTIGRDGEADGRVTGLALQVFDVTNATAPALLHKEVLGSEYAYSEAERQHKAFTYDGARGLLAFPLVSYAPETGAVQSTLELFHVGIDDGFRRLGGIDHSAFFGGTPETGCYGYYSPEVRRGLFIESYVYSVSHGGVIASSLDDLSTPVASLALPAPFESWGDCGVGVEPEPAPVPGGAE